MSNNRVYVVNLAYRVTWYDLKDYMRSAGDVVHAKVLTSHNGQSKGSGVVEFSNPEDAQRAIDELDGTELLGRTIFVREDRVPPTTVSGAGGSGGSGEVSNASTTGLGPVEKDSSDQKASGDADSTGKGFALFVGNLPYSVNWAQLKQLFSAAGEVVRADVHLAMHRSSRGHGTVVFANEEGAKNAIAQFNGYDLDGRILEVREDKPAGERPVPFLWCSAFGDPSETIHISNLPWSTTESDLVDLFQSIGTLTRSHLQTFPDGRPSGNGVVRYESLESAQMAVTKLNKYNYGSRELQVSFARYPPRA